MAEKPWKRTERAVASLLGTRRVPVTGRSRGDVPDVEHRWLSIEVKHRKKLPEWIKDAVRQAEAAADEEQLPVVVLHEERSRHTGDLVVLKMRDFLEWFGTEKDTS